MRHRLSERGDGTAPAGEGRESVDRRRIGGFTLVEAVIVAVVIAALLAVLIPILREREGQRLQALAGNEPWEVFMLTAEPAKESFAWREDVVIECEITNITDYPLLIEGLKKKWGILLALDDTIVAVAGRPSSWPMDGQLSLEENIVNAILAVTNGFDRLSQSVIAPGDSVKFELIFLKIDSGVWDLRATFWHGSYIQPGDFVIGERGEWFPVEERFQSNPFRVRVESDTTGAIDSGSKIERW